MQAQQYCTRALRLIGILSEGQTASGAKLTDAMDVLIDLVDSWKTMSLTIFKNLPNTFHLVSNQQIYKIGTAAGTDFNTDAPEWIDAAAVVSLTNPVQPLEIPLSIVTDSEWASIPVKSQTSPLPTTLWYTRFGQSEATPANSRIYLWPIPTIANDITLYMPNPLSSTIVPSTDLAVRAGWRKALRFNLAKDLLPQYGQVDPKVAANVMQVADDSLADIKRVNSIDDYPELNIDKALQPRSGVWDWRLGLTR